MNRRIIPSAVASGMAFAALAACSTPYSSPVEVTRFTGEAPARLGSGTIQVRAAPGLPGDSLEFSLYQQAVARELERIGYRVQAQGTAQQVAELRIAREQLAPADSRGPVSVGVGGSTGSYGSGLGLGLGIDLSGPEKPVIDTEMAVIIRDNGTGQALWEGRARFGAGTDSPYAERRAAADRLASALFGGFPGPSGETISVK